MDDEVGITYDCGNAFVTTEYCIHFISRTRTIPEERLLELVDYAESLGLNTLALNMTYIPQDGCPPVY